MYKLVFVLILLGLMLLFIFQNMARVSVNFLFWHIESSSAFLLFLVFIAGIAVGVLFTLYVRRRKSKVMA